MSPTSISKFKNPRAKYNFQGRTCSISGVGSYVPDKILTNAELEQLVHTSDEWITTRTGIKERRLAAKNEFTSDMAAQAALRAMQRAGDFEGMPKREALRHSRELEKLDRNLSGIANLDRVPDAIFVIDTKKEHIAVTEARKLGLPVVAVVDTNCDPDVIDFVIPGNDDAIRSVALLSRLIADAVTEGRFIRQNRPATATTNA